MMSTTLPDCTESTTSSSLDVAPSSAAAACHVLISSNAVLGHRAMLIAFSLTVCRHYLRSATASSFFALLQLPPRVSQSHHSRQMSPVCYLTLYNSEDILPHRIIISKPTVTFGTARRGLGGASARPGPSSLYQM